MARQIDNRTSAFQGMRLIAIFGIVIGHLYYNLIGGGPQLCSFFFILSGFLYKGINLQRESFAENWRNYLVRKAKGLFPVYWFCLASYLLLAVIRRSPAEYHIDLSFIPHFFLLQSWFPWDKSMAFIGPSWFLSSLLFCYILSPIIWYYIKRYRSYSLFVFAILFMIWLHYSQSIPWLLYVSPLYRVLEYSAGIFLHSFIFDRPQSKEIHWSLSIMVILGYFFGLHYVTNILLFDFMHLLVIAYIYLESSTLLTKTLGNKYVVWLSQYDIFIYLTHPGIAFHFMFPIIGLKAWPVAIGSMFIGVAIGMIYERIRGLFQRSIC